MIEFCIKSRNTLQFSHKHTVQPKSFEDTQMITFQHFPHQITAQGPLAHSLIIRYIFADSHIVRLNHWRICFIDLGNHFGMQWRWSFSSMPVESSHHTTQIHERGRHIRVLHGLPALGGVLTLDFVRNVSLPFNVLRLRLEWSNVSRTMHDQLISSLLPDTIRAHTRVREQISFHVLIWSPLSNPIECFNQINSI